MFFETIFPCDAGYFWRNPCDAAMRAAMRAMRSRQYGMFPAIWALRCEAAMRIARFAMRDAEQLSSRVSNSISRDPPVKFWH